MLVYFNESQYSPSYQSEAASWGSVLAFKKEFSQNTLFKGFKDLNTFRRIIYQDLLVHVMRIESNETGGGSGRIDYRLSGIERVIRAEGMAELVGDISIELGVVSDDQKLEIDISFNVPVTNQWNRVTGLPRLTIDGAQEVTGEVTSHQSIRFAGIILKARTVGQGSRQIRVSNVRVNVSRLGIPAEDGFLESRIMATVEMRSLDVNTRLSIDGAGVVCVGVPILGMLSAINSLSGHLMTALHVSAESQITVLAKSAPVVNRCAQIVCREGFAGSFSSARLDESCGTRFLARFFNVPEGIRLFVSAIAEGERGDSSGVIDGLKALFVRGAGADGGGGRVVDLRDEHLFIRGVDEQSYVELQAHGGYAQGVWEVERSGALEEGIYSVAIVVGVSGDNSIDVAPGSAQVAVSLCPISTVGTGSNYAPVPRFIDSSGNPETFLVVLGEE